MLVQIQMETLSEAENSSSGGVWEVRTRSTETRSHHGCCPCWGLFVLQHLPSPGWSQFPWRFFLLGFFLKDKVRKQKGKNEKKKKGDFFKSTVIPGKAEDPSKVFVYYQVFPQDQIQGREVWSWLKPA